MSNSLGIAIVVLVTVESSIAIVTREDFASVAKRNARTERRHLA
jgi:hypothetical protein